MDNGMVGALALMGVFFLATFIQGATGFGSALVAMPLLISLLGLDVAAPLFALQLLIVESLMIAHYRKSLSLKDIRPLVIGTLLGTGVGILIVDYLNQEVVLTGLGVFILAYVGYVVLNMRPMPLRGVGWAYGFGFIAGALNGAYNTAGPPYVVYGQSQAWAPVVFKTNLQTLFLLAIIFVIGGHLLVGNYTATVLEAAVIALPGSLLGMVAGISLDRYIRPEAFNRVVLVVLFLIGLNLLR
ncbi:MAG: sulfite exporter TauE/SafE family protein [Anaerolineae bacterium]|nr:sulfite exporter TauE/SafE family protein [Anaerolineae bacterium]